MRVQATMIYTNPVGSVVFFSQNEVRAVWGGTGDDKSLLQKFLYLSLNNGLMLRGVSAKTFPKGLSIPCVDCMLNSWNQANIKVTS